MIPCVRISQCPLRLTDIRVVDLQVRFRLVWISRWRSSRRERGRSKGTHSSTDRDACQTLRYVVLLQYSLTLALALAPWKWGGGCKTEMHVRLCGMQIALLVSLAFALAPSMTRATARAATAMAVPPFGIMRFCPNLNLLEKVISHEYILSP